MIVALLLVTLLFIGSLQDYNTSVVTDAPKMKFYISMKHAVIIVLCLTNIEENMIEIFVIILVLQQLTISIGMDLVSPSVSTLF